MFWVHDKFGNGLDDPNGLGWPDDPVDRETQMG